MKLLTKTSLNFITLSVIIFMAGSVLFYAHIRSAINNSINNELIDYKDNFFNKFPDTLQLNKIVSFDAIIINLEPGITTENFKQNFSDTILKPKKSERYYLYRNLKARKTTTGQVYTFSRPLKTADDLIANLSILLVAIFTLFFTALFFLNWFTMKKSWSSFYNTLDRLKSYNLSKDHVIKLNSTDVQEFSELNEVIHELTERIANDFDNLKEYTENASHEIQTPLAIISIKVEQLLQSENFTNKQLEQISSIYEAARRLSQMNKSLIYLTNIDKRKFASNTELSLKSILNRNLAFFEDFIEAKLIKVNLDILDDKQIHINKDLADTLFQNLIKNAIKHNIINGEIDIRLSGKYFSISNTSDYTADNPQTFFKRFKKSNPNSQSPGIGLAIVKKVCLMYKIKIDYTCKARTHKIVLQF